MEIMLVLLFKVV